MMSRGDAGGVSGHGGSGSASNNKGIVYYTRKIKSTMPLYIHCGVPAWWSGEIGEGEVENYLKFGGLEEDNATLPTTNRYFTPSSVYTDTFNESFDFFTYDPSPEGISSFESPFWYQPSSDGNYPNKYKGVLTNMYAGCEPVCDVLAKLLKDGLFYGFPYNPGVGYVFRKNVPRYIFIFTNEFDNAAVKTYSLSNGIRAEEITVFPYPIDNGVRFQCDLRNKKTRRDQNPVDPYCLNILNESRTNTTYTESFNTFVNSVKMEGENPTTTISELSNLVRENINVVNISNKNLYLETDKGVAMYNLDNPSSHNGITWRIFDIDMSKPKDTNWAISIDINGMGYPFVYGDHNPPTTSLITQMQWKDWFTGRYILGWNREVDNSGKKPKYYETIDYDWLKTIGFYQLRNAA
jgi:hypothetical protein